MHAVLEVGGTHVIAAIVDLTRQEVVIVQRRELDSSAGAEEILGTFAEVIEGLGPRAHGLPLVVAIPGPFDYDRGVGDFEGVAKFRSLKGVDLRGALAARLGTTASFVNDVTAYGMGQYELMNKPARMIALTLGTGVGSCFLDDGQPVDDGPLVPPQGWVHLLRHNGRPLEERFSRRAIVAEYERRSGALMDVIDIAALARAGDASASLVVQHAFTALAVALAPWLARFEAELVVVGGSITKSWDLAERWFVPMLLEDFGTSTAARPRVTAGVSSDTAALIGAARYGSTR